jgi:predicted transcriptional regulator
MAGSELVAVTCSDIRPERVVKRNVEERRRDREGPEMASCDSFPSHVGVSTRKVNDMPHKDTSLNRRTSLMARFHQTECTCNNG